MYASSSVPWIENVPFASISQRVREDPNGPTSAYPVTTTTFSKSITPRSLASSDSASNGFSSGNGSEKLARGAILIWVWICSAWAPWTDL